MTEQRVTPWRRVMGGRNPDEDHRAATPLELLFDLCFVVAVAQAAAQWHHALAEGHVGAGLAGYVMVFFAIWWAWMNFTWFASAYDTDDVPYRVLTLVQMAGVLVLAAGVPAAFTDYDLTVITIGYVIMRVAMVGQWLRAAAEDPAGRAAALRYAAGIAAVQVGWVARLGLAHPWDYAGFVLLAAAELAVPIWAEARGRTTNWHPGHIAERYGLFTIIVLGEVILGTLLGVRAALDQHGLTGPILMIVLGGLLVVFTLWWIYFTGNEGHLGSQRIALTWGYGHYLVFAAVAAVGAGLEVSIDSIEHVAHTTPVTAALAVAVPVAVYLLVLAALHRITATATVGHPGLMVGTAVLVLVLGLLTGRLGVGAAVLAIGLATTLALATSLMLRHRRAGRAAPG